MKVLSIGNSFSFDAHTYLHQLAKTYGVDMKLVNLFIGGCELRRHYLNALDDKFAYEFCFNGQATKLLTSIRMALESDTWDIVTLQQASAFSPDFNTYSPYIEYLCEYVKKYSPKSKIYIHQTWAYEDGSAKLKEILNYDKAVDMYKDLASAYKKAHKLISADGLIPCGTAMINGAKAGLKMHRDCHHASLGVGRYLLALTWLKTLTGVDISNDTFNDLDEPITENERKLIIDAVNNAF